jgi:hypothetical protein
MATILEEKPRSGTLKSQSTGFGHGTFGSARFGETSGYETTKEPKVAESSTKELKT